jgi:Thiolase, N-terminal domain
MQKFHAKLKIGCRASRDDCTSSHAAVGNCGSLGRYEILPRRSIGQCDALTAGPAQFDKEEHNRPDTALETLARLKPAFRPNGTITAGNAPGLNDARRQRVGRPVSRQQHAWYLTACG